MMRSLSTSALGQPSETKEMRGAARPAAGALTSSIRSSILSPCHVGARVATCADDERGLRRGASSAALQARRFKPKDGTGPPTRRMAPSSASNCAVDKVSVIAGRQVGFDGLGHASNQSDSPRTRGAAMRRRAPPVNPRLLGSVRAPPDRPAAARREGSRRIGAIVARPGLQPPADHGRGIVARTAPSACG